MTDATFWRAAFEYGLAFTIACSAFVFMVWYVKTSKKETREDLLEKNKLSALDRDEMRQDIIRMSSRITTQEEFIRDKLLTVVSENSRVLTVFAATFEELNVTIAKLNGSMTSSPCLWLKSLREDERLAIEKIIDRTKGESV